MKSGQPWSFIVVLTLLVLLAFVLVSIFAENSGAGSVNATAMLSMITACAIGIERVIEGFWTIIGMTKGAWWPLNLVDDEVNGLVNNLNTQLEPVYKQAYDAAEKMKAAGEMTQAQLEKARKEIDDLQSRIEKLKQLAPDNQRVNLIAATAFQGISYLEKKYPDYVTTANLANQAITGVSDFVATFKDNPGRRLISIYLGSLLGLIVAGTVGLDLFKATGLTLKSLPSLPFTSVALTGLLMGLGSNPTHEVIRAIQEYKKSRKADNDPAPSIATPTAAATGSARGMAQPASPVTSGSSHQVNTFSLRRS
ncbi:MAG TPA: hypothetical protein VIW80_00235 [Pyrinomonadaceae bacterium]|jgi:hypothetical protein